MLINTANIQHRFNQIIQTYKDYTISPFCYAYVRARFYTPCLSIYFSTSSTRKGSRHIC